MKQLVIAILTWEAKMIVRKYKPFIVAVTGSVGKTSTKDAIYDVLKDKFPYVRKSEKSLNSEFGLPLTVIGVPTAWRSMRGWLDNMAVGLGYIFKRKEYPNCLVLEVGADHPGDIKRVVKWLRPDISVITLVSRTPVHVEYFDSPEQVFEEKSALATGVKDGGALVLYGDDDRVLTMADRVKGRNVSVISYGLRETCTVRAADVGILYENNEISGMSLKLVMGGEERIVRLRGITGETYAYPLLAAAAVGSKDHKIDEIARALEGYHAPKGRMNVIPGIHGSTIIDDTYNSSPDAAMAALHTLKGLQTSGRKIAVLGDMLELGKYSSEEHRRIGREAATGIDRLITVGQRSKLTAEESMKSGMNAVAVKSFDTSNEAAEYIKGEVTSGDVILVKGSQGGRMERVTRTLMREPEKAEKLLVRQEKEWLAKA